MQTYNKTCQIPRLFRQLMRLLMQVRIFHKLSQNSHDSSKISFFRLDGTSPETTFTVSQPIQRKGKINILIHDLCDIYLLIDTHGK